MSQIDTEEVVLSETIRGQGEIENNLRLVPVAESIRYRKRAQAAEKKIELLAEELSKAKTEAQDAAEQLETIREEKKLSSKLAAAGAIDLETAVLVAKMRIKDDRRVSLNEVIENLRKDKGYLFLSNEAGMLSPPRTSGVKDMVIESSGVLEKAAKKASTTGRRVDLHEYMQLRKRIL